MNINTHKPTNTFTPNQGEHFLIHTSLTTENPMDAFNRQNFFFMNDV